jgi:hypothetical protein
MKWEEYRCGICGSTADMGIMSLVARCVSDACQAESVEVYPPSKWDYGCAWGAD